MQRTVKLALGTETFEPTGSMGGGSISSGASYFTDTGQVFVKWNNGTNALQMFEGEKEGLLAIMATKTVRCPKPIRVVPLNETGSAALIMGNIFMKPLSSTFQQAKLGEQIARLHQSNSLQIKRHHNNESRVNRPKHSDDDDYSSSDEEARCTAKPILRFGFHVPTSCGYHLLDNSWCDTWDVFYIRQRLQPLVDALIKSHSDRELSYTWPLCSLQIEKILTNVKDCKPALLHGDLWSGNVGSANGEPVIFDPGVFYGHSEFDFGIGSMFHGFSRHFFDSYHSILHRTSGFDKRLEVYELFHHLNHWNHFGSKYRDSSMKLMKKIAKSETDDLQ